jgi:hypothetical protein
MQRLIALLGWLSFAVWLLSSPGCGGRIDGWSLVGIPEAPAAEALAEWSSVGYPGALDPAGVHTIQLAMPGQYSWLGKSGRDSTGTRGMIWIAPDVPADRLRVLILHELGHWYRGHGHLPPGNVMSHYLDDCAEHLTDADICGSWGEP